MSHHIYQTKAFVVESFDIGEANKMIALFTADLGFIYAVAQGVRLMKSKLKASIQDMSFSKVSLVRGREVWRLTNAEKLISLYDKRIPTPLRKLLAEELSFVRRLVQGENRHEELFNLMSKLCDFVLKNQKFSLDHIPAIDSLAKVNILRELGYGSDEVEVKEFIVSDFNQEIVLYAEKNVVTLKSHIRVALQSSHL